MKAKIFLVSQDLEKFKLIGDTLEHEGHKVMYNDIPATAVSKCKEEKFDLIFIDASIRDVKYEDIVKDFKKACPETEIIIVTSYAFPESIAMAEALDITGYLIQPLSVDKIKNTARRALKQGQLARENRRLLLAVTAAKKEWEATVDAIEDPIFVTDFDYTILRANLATFRELGTGVNDVVGHKCYEILHCSNHELDDCPGKRARDSGEPASETMLFRGLKKRMTCSVYPQVFAAGGGLVHYLCEPAINAEQQAETMAKYERLFDDARVPILLVSIEDYKVVDANQKAIELFKYEPEMIFDMDLEDLFAQSLRETVISNITNQTKDNEAPLKVKALDHQKNEIDVFVIANSIEIGENIYIQICVLPTNLLSGGRVV
jgi:PAS domain-containing protein